MDTVNMLNTMRFYCQPILPLVYDESMSYYETLCKVVGQLNTTGDAVNKLNEGLTNEIADRQAADAALDERLKGEISDRQKADSLLNERLKVVEAATNKTHFLAFAGTPPYGAKPIGTMPTRDELRHWVNDGDMIVTLLETQEEGRNAVYAASCSYNAGNWTNESSDDFNIIVPISTAYDSEGDYAVRQKIAKITIPPASASSLDEKWGLQIIEVNTPSTSAEGVVNLTASLYGSNEVNCSITPSEFLELYNMTRGGKNLCVAVNARLEYDAHIRSSSIATVNPYVGTIVITFEEDDGVYTDYGVNQTIRVIHYLIGNAETNTWEHESIRSRIQDFVRYEGFQFTRKSGNVIATENDSTPSAVYSYYTQLNGKLYQNLPTRLIDEVDGAEYWNGIFDSYSDGRITFTFTTANYATIGDKMTVRVIELSATKAGSMWSGAEKWSYAAKEFDIPYRQTFYALDVWETSDTPAVINGIVTYAGGSNLDFDDLLPLVENNQRFVATLHKGISETAPEWSSLVYSSQSVKNGVGNITFAITTGINLENGIPVMDGTVVFSKDASGAKKVQIVFASALPAPSADGSDNGKIPTVKGAKWELKTPSGGASDFVINGTINDDNSLTIDKTYAQIQEAVQGGKRVTLKVNKYTIDISLPLIGENDTDYIFEASLTVFPTVSLLFFASIGADRNSWNIDQLIVADSSGNLAQISMDRDPEQPMEIATKQYVDTHAGFKYLTYDAMTASADMTPAEVRAFIAANPHMPVYMIIKNLGTNLPPAWGALQGATSSDGVLAFVATVFSNNSGNQKYIVVTSVSDTAWSTANQRYLLSEVLPSLSAPSFYTSTGTPAFGVTEDSIIAKADGSYMRTATGDDVVNGESYVGLGLKRIYFETGEDASTDDIYKVVGRDSILCDIAFVLGCVILDGSAEGTITGYNTDVYAQILREINYGRCSIWLKFNGETIRVASWKQTGSGAYTLTFFGAGAAAQPVKYVVTASASAASLAVTGS